LASWPRKPPLKNRRLFFFTATGGKKSYVFFANNIRALGVARAFVFCYNKKYQYNLITMRTRENLSEAAQWFLNDLQNALDALAETMSVQIFIIAKDGSLVSKLKGAQRACQMILALEDGRIRCQDHFRMALSLIEVKRESVFVECYAGFASLWTPIVINGKFMGVIVSCGGRYDKKYGAKEVKEKLSKIADEIGIMPKHDFIKAGEEEVVLVDENKLKIRAKNLEGLFALLAKTTITPLKEAFG